MNPVIRKLLFRTLCIAEFILISGCSTPPEPAPAIEFPKTCFEELQASAAARLDSGMLSVVGSAESQSAELAHKRALTDGRKRLARMLDAKMDLLLRTAAEETGKPVEDPVFNPLSSISKTITRTTIQPLSPARVEEETINSTVRVYCLMELNPQTIIDQLAEETELYAILKPTQSLALLFRNINAAEAASVE